MNRAVGPMGACQIANAHQELADDLAACEDERLLEQLDPLGLVARVMGGEPFGEGAELAAEALDPPGVLNGGIDLEPVADDPGVGQQTGTLTLAVAGDAVD